MSKPCTHPAIDDAMKALRTATSASQVVDIPARTDHSAGYPFKRGELRHALSTAGWAIPQPADAPYWIGYAPEGPAFLIYVEPDASPHQP